VIERKSLKV